MNVVSWQPHASPLVMAALVVVILVWVRFLQRRLRERWGSTGAWRLVVPKCALLALLLLALLDPALEVAVSGSQRTLLLLIDQSSSMDVIDPGPVAQGRTRRERAEAIAEAIRVPAGMTIARCWFDSELHHQPIHAPTQPSTHPGTSAGGERGTDIASCLQQAARVTAAGACAGVVLLSDGGDEAVSSQGLPTVPLATIGIGSDLSGARNTAIVDASLPATAERGVAFVTAVDCAATGEAAFRSRLTSIPLSFEILEPNGAWRLLERSPVDLSHGRARASFRTTPERTGAVRYRVRLEPQSDEISILDNQRAMMVDVRERSLHVLYISRSLGLGFKPLRAELARDPGISFTALYRTIGGTLAHRTGERFTIQGDRRQGDEDLTGGLPSSPEVLAGYDCLIIGSFAASEWSAVAQQAVVSYVAGGGAAIFLGGEDAFGRGGYADTPLAALLPWQINAAEPALVRGAFPLSVPPEAQGHAITQGLPPHLLAPAAIASLNQPGALKGGAVALLQASLPSGTVAVVAVQSYGKGRSLGIASDTLWRLANGADGGAYGLFWRQAIRWLADRGEGGQVLRVSWDKSSYRPGDTAHAVVRVTSSGQGGRISAAVDGPLGHSDLAPAAAPASEGVAWSLSVPLEQRGDYQCRIVAYQDATALETYEKTLAVAPGLPEGARLARDDAGLKALAEAHAGIYAPEEDVTAIPGWVASLAHQERQVQPHSLVFSGPWWFAAVMACLVWEWLLRRRRNVI